MDSYWARYPRLHPGFRADNNAGNMTRQVYDIAIIGGGIVGCALARALGIRFDKVLLLEKEGGVACHTSGRNSGVVHSGFNPTPGTLKAKLCVEGGRLIRELCHDRGVRCEQVGTLVVAVDEREMPILDGLKKKGEQNGVPGIEIVPIEQVRSYEPNVKGIAAFHSPAGAIVDSVGLTQAVANESKQLGVDIALGQEVLAVREGAMEVEVTTRTGTFCAQLVVNCAGLHADRLAHMMGVGRDYVIAPFRGEYFIVRRPGPPIIRSMVYPVPNPIVPFLGVHLTKSVDGTVLVGPNAVPAFGREAYSRFSIGWKDLREIATHKGTWTAFRKNRALVGIAWNELRNSCSRRHFHAEASRLVCGLRPEDLALDSRVGIRPQLIHANGHLVEDLVIETTPRSIHILNVVSPGMTSSLAFADWVSGGISGDLRWTRAAEVGMAPACAIARTDAVLNG